MSDDEFENDVQDIIEKFTNVPACTLFQYDKGKEIVREIYVPLNRNWKEFAEELGLKCTEIEYLEVSRYKDQEPIETILRWYRYQPGSTISKIILILKNLPRWDILRNIIELLNEFLQLNPTPGYLDSLQLDIPKYLQRAGNIIIRSIDNEQEVYTHVFLTFLTENIGKAAKVAEFLQQDFNGEKIGVLVLHNLHETLFRRKTPTEVIDTFFKYCKFVIPIITPEYLNLIHSDNPYIQYDDNNVDSKYAKYIFEKMQNHLLHHNNNSSKIRPVLFQDDVDEVRKHPKFDNLAFQHWKYFENLDELAQAILLKTNFKY